MNKKHYLIYQITNTVNNKIYIGKHITENVDDDYFGSGKYLKRAQKKYGLDKFVKTILFECQNKEEMDLLEKCVVTQEFCDRDDTYNINVGGDGGWSYVNTFDPFQHEKCVNAGKCGGLKSIENAINAGYSGIFAYSTRNKSQQEMQQIHDKRKRNHALYIASRNIYGKNNPMFGKQHSQSSRKKMSKSHLGEKNNNYGKMWICNDITHESKMIFKSEIIPNGWRKGRFCK